MRHLLAATCLTPVALLAAGGTAHAQSVIGAPQTTPVRTSTVNGGNPNGIRISTAGAVRPTSGTAVTIDSSHSVQNEGTVQITGASNANGILANPGVNLQHHQ